MQKQKVEAPPPVARVWDFFETYTRELRADDFQRLFTRETPEAWHFFAKAIKADELSNLPWHVRAAEYARRAFLAFTLRLSPARRAIYGIALFMAFIGLFKLFAGFVIVRAKLRLPKSMIADGAILRILNPNAPVDRIADAALRGLGAFGIGPARIKERGSLR